MRAMKNPVAMWGFGLLMVPFCAIGLLAAATLIALPLYGIAYALGASSDTLLKVILFSAVLWAPLGFGGGIMTSAVLLRGVKAKGPDQEDH
jgi:hypothetical protein